MATPQAIKNISRNSFVRGLACSLSALYIRFIWWTGRWRIDGLDVVHQLWEEEQPFIVCFWHGRLLMTPKTWNRSRPFHMLISNHADGRLISGTVAHFGITTTTGSTTRGGSAAFRSLVKILKEGGHVGITPDGPAGPRMRATLGAIALARLSGTPIVPLTFGVSRRKVMSSWDRFILPLPFARGVICWGRPIEIAEDADNNGLEAARRQLENDLNRLTDEADRMCGQPPIEPAPEAVAAGNVSAEAQP